MLMDSIQMYNFHLKSRVDGYLANKTTAPPPCLVTQPPLSHKLNLFITNHYQHHEQQTRPLRIAGQFKILLLLPSDIRFLIWEQTFTPRTIPSSTTTTTSLTTTPDDWDGVAFDRLFALPPSMPAPLPFDLPGPLSSIAPDPVAWLEACKGSRDFAIKAGYRE
ncbi:hypothetical protein BDZ45DRAFT_738665 [Acephala macrosclerotiorum]|nr:hypothetical protein BDZ45DRAFT_738665 [Acephala macrosclerotiorum]